MKKILSLWILLPALFLGFAPEGGRAQIGIAISVNLAPPPLPVYEQPPCPVEGYLWTPGYWAWDPDYGYYWVPGVWVAPPQPGLLWTPGYWGYESGAYGWHDGYWAPNVGYYGGVDYGWGYDGDGFVGGRWAGRVFRYNTAVVRVNTTVIRNVYVDRTVVVRREGPRASFNGPGGMTARPSARDEQAMHERHFQRTGAQTQHWTRARRDPQARFAANHGAPRAAAMTRVGQRPVAATNRPSPEEIRAAQAQSRGAHSPGAMARPGAGGENRPMTGRNAATRPNVNRPPTARPNEARPARPNPPVRNLPSRPETRPNASGRNEAVPARPSTRRPEARPMPRPEARPETRPAPHPAERPAPPPQVRPTSRPAPHPAERPAPRPQERPQTRPESRPAPHPAERPAAPPHARPAPRPQPHPESHPAPHPEEKPH